MVGFLKKAYHIRYSITLTTSCQDADLLKDVQLVLQRTDKGQPYFIYRLDQRTIKNNKDPENITQVQSIFTVK